MSYDVKILADSIASGVRLTTVRRCEMDETKAVAPTSAACDQYREGKVIR